MVTLLLSVAVVVGVVAWFVDNWTARAIGLIVAAVLVVWGLSLYQDHRVESCHRAGGVIAQGSSAVCMKPHSEIDID